MFVSNNNFILLCTVSLSMDAKIAMVGFILFFSLALTALAESPPIGDSPDCIKPKPTLCPKNEERYCRYPCPPETCITLYAAFRCIQNQTCVNGCYCKQGFLRIGQKGPCVPRDQCNPLECVNDPNAQRGCGDKCGKTCADYKSNAICPKRPCKNDGCACKEGYIYDQNLSLCVKPKDCTPNKCGKNEEFYCGPSCPDSEASCSNPNPPTCINKKCELKCFCKKGFVRDANKACIPANKCPKRCSKPHERYSNCLLGECVAKTCDELGKQLPCPDIAPPCAGGCICERGYVRDKHGNCINAKSCPTCGGDPNAESGCGNPCGRTCANLRNNAGNKRDTSAVACATYCEVNGCDCKKGYILNTDVNPPRCVLPEDCNKPVNCTKPHERYIDCVAGQCGPKSCDDLGKSLSCPFIRGPCPGGCICDEGYLRNSEGACIKLENCPAKPCGRNQTWMSPCNIPCPYPRCPRDDKPPPPCVDIQPCYPGCQCKLNYLRNSTGHCILAPDCPPVKCTRQNEVWDRCPSACLAESCEDIDRQPTTCNTLIWLCSPRCVCKKGHFRNKDGLCVPASECNCIKPKPPLCPKNEEHYCRNPCPPETCVTLYAAFLCIQNQTCVNGCYCKQGFLRIGQNGPCVPRDQCNPLECVNDPNARRGCGDKCGKTCADYKSNAICPKRPCKNDGCECKEGYIYDQNLSLCVKPKDCTKQCTKPHERYSNCLLIECVPRSCDELGKPLSCLDIFTPPCAGGCICEHGYVRDEDGNCINAKSCPSCGEDPNAESGCGNPCGQTCANLRNNTRNTSAVACATLCILNGCDCKKGYILNTDVNPPRCVLPEDCYKHKQCRGPHETYIDCPAAQCYPKTCDDLVTPPGCPKVKPPCPGGCVCEKGYLRDSKGICIKKEKCPSMKCKKPHERYSNCFLGECVPKKCDDVGYPVACPDIIGPCAGGCICEEGFVRDCNGDCIDMKECPCCGGDPNAVSGCGNPCGKTCASLYANKSDLVCAQYCEYNGCDCKPGFLLLESNNTDSKKCVPERNCPKPPQQCGVNEQYYCGTSCPEATCANPTHPTCVNKKCKLGCFCKKGFVRDANNKCIPVEKCPPKCKGPHEIYIDCPDGQCNAKTCKDLIIAPPCPRIIPPCPGGCVCEEGYLRDSKGICIKKEQCPSMKCKKPHERYSNCLLGECVPKKCDDVGYPVPCPDIIGPCAGGCICEEGFVRDCNGDCIDMKDCPCCGGDPNAVSGCGNPCGNTCASLYANKSDLVCPQYCEYNGCDCKPGFLLLESNNTDSKKCVPERKCPKPPQQCGVNEQYYCGTSCPEATCANPTPPTCFNKKCKLGCFCKKGFVRDANNKCIPVEKCPPKCKGPHEIYIDCPDGQCNAKTCKDLIIAPPCPRIIPPCPGGCVCEEGYLRDSKGMCIKKEQCPSVCKDPNASWTDCKDACPGTCQNTRPGCVNVKCSAGCQCNVGYVLSKIGGKCVKIETCADYADCCGNQTFVECTFKCPQVMCPESDQTLLCKPPRDCPGGCGCKPYYRYNATGHCVKASDCPPVECTRVNEEWTSCQRISDWERCEERYNTPPIYPGHPDDCTPKCVCNKGYWRNAANECVTEKECPPIDG